MVRDEIYNIEKTPPPSNHMCVKIQNAKLQFAACSCKASTGKYIGGVLKSFVQGITSLH